MSEQRPRQEIPEWIAYSAFGGLAIVLILLAGLFWELGWDLPKNLALNLGVSIGAVVVVEVIWRQTGGAPLSGLIHRFIGLLDDLKSATALISDTEGTGLARLGLQRRHGATDHQPDFEKWCDWIREAKTVDMMGINLRSDWFNDRNFRERLVGAVRSNDCHVRVITLSPKEGDALTDRRIDEESNRFEDVPALRIRDYILETHGHVANMRQNMQSDGKAGNIESKVATKSAIYCYYVRVDNRMLVSPYMSSLSGGNSPWFEIHGPDAAFFRIFETEFENMWRLKTAEPQGTI